MRQYARVVAVTLTVLFALPIAGWSDPADFTTDIDLEPGGTVTASLAAGTITGHGSFRPARHLGPGEWDLDLTLAPRVSEPLCRDASGTMRFTVRSGDSLLFSMFGVLCYDPNTGEISNTGPDFVMKLVDATGRFAGSTGSGVWEMVAVLDDSGTSGTVGPNFVTVVVNRP